MLLPYVTVSSNRLSLGKWLEYSEKVIYQGFLMSLTLTESAAKKIANLIEKEPNLKTAFFRVMVNGGGCAGFQYNFSLDHEMREDDHTFEDKGVKIVIDEASLPFVEEAEVDFVEELIGASFQVKNPLASSSCGCGSSFSV